MIHFRGRQVERFPVERGYEALLVSTSLSFMEGDVVAVDGERLLVVQCARTVVDHFGARPQTSRTVLLTRQVADISVWRAGGGVREAGVPARPADRDEAHL